MIARSLALCSLALCSLSAADPSLNQIRTVYLLPMSGGLDQYLANRLVREGRFHVVTDPERADAILTDRLGADFEARMRELYPPPPPPKSGEEKEDTSMAALLQESAGTSGARISSFSRGKGNVFLVDRQTRQVLWSHYARQGSTRPDALHDLAGDLAAKLHAEAKKLSKTAARVEKASPPPPPPAEPAKPALPEPAAPVKPAPPEKQ